MIKKAMTYRTRQNR